MLFDNKEIGSRRNTWLYMYYFPFKNLTHETTIDLFNHIQFNASMYKLDFFHSGCQV